MIYQYINDLPENFAFNATIASNVPVGSGLSSSAALEIAMATFLEKLCPTITISSVDKALRCQIAEHTFADMPCGIMDQFVSAMGKKGNLLLIDCRKNEGTLIPFTGPQCPVLVVTNSNVHHKLTGSEFPDRVRQCKEATRVLSAKYPHIKNLRDATMLELDAIADDIPTVVYNRARHAIKENLRTCSAVEALKKSNFNEVGKLMTMSHISLKDDYEVSDYVYTSSIIGVLFCFLDFLLGEL